MTDDADRAKILEMRQRQNALDNVLSKPDRNTGEEQLIIDKTVCCLDCYSPIGAGRLKAKPDAVRCVICKDKWEQSASEH